MHRHHAPLLPPIDGLNGHVDMVPVAELLGAARDNCPDLQQHRQAVADGPDEALTALARMAWQFFTGFDLIARRDYVPVLSRAYPDLTQVFTALHQDECPTEAIAQLEVTSRLDLIRWAIGAILPPEQFGQE